MLREEEIGGKFYAYLEAGNPESKNKVLHIHGLVGSENNFILQFENPQVVGDRHHMALNMHAVKGQYDFE